MTAAASTSGFKAVVNITTWLLSEPPIIYAAVTGTLPGWCRWWFAGLALLWAFWVVIGAAKASAK